MAILTPCSKCGHLIENDRAEDPSVPDTEREPLQGGRRRFGCPKCGEEGTWTKSDPESEVESWENEGGSAWGRDLGPWEG